jgi:hypothetical protein
LHFGLRTIGIWNATVNGTDHRAGFLVKKADTLTAPIGNYVEKIFGQRLVGRALVLILYSALVDRRVGTLRLAGGAVYTIVGYYRSHIPPF